MDLLLVATRNWHKTREFRELLGPKFQLRDLNDVQVDVAVAESGSTFEENAAIKALALSRLFPEEIVIADDRAQRAVEAILEKAKTGKIGDGKIFVTEVEEAVRIRTGERGVEAL